MNLARMLLCLDVFSEFDLIRFTLADGALAIEILHFEGKADINGSKILSRLSMIKKA